VTSSPFNLEVPIWQVILGTDGLQAHTDLLEPLLMREQHCHQYGFKRPRLPQLHLCPELLRRTCKHPIKRRLILFRQRAPERHPPAPFLLDHLIEGHYPETYSALSARTESLRKKTRPNISTD
jgi:hypothetical protein